MKRDGILIVIVLALVLGLVTYFVMNGNKKAMKYQWFKTYQEGYKNPYDFGLFKDLVKKDCKNFKQATKEVLNSLEELSGKPNSSYVFIGKICYLTKEEIDSLLNFASRGNSVLIIAESVPDTLLSSFWYSGYPISIERFNQKTVNVKSDNFLSDVKNYEFSYMIGNDTFINDWEYINFNNNSPFVAEAENSYPLLRLSTVEDLLNYARFKVGLGSVSINTTPFLFTNYHLKTANGFHYASEVFSEIPREHVVYDIYSRTFKEESSSISKNDDSPLSYILRQRSLKWAWYIFLFTVALFFIFKIKRAQRIIPVIEQKHNTTLDFVDTLSNLYLGKTDNSKMAESKMNLFLFFIKHKLKLSVNPKETQHYDMLSIRSGVGKDTIESIFVYYRTLGIEHGEVSAQELMELNNRISQFYNIYYKTNKQ